MSETRPFTIRTDVAPRIFGLVTVLLYGGFMRLTLEGSHGLARALPVVFLAAIWIVAGTPLMLGVSAVTVDPLAGTLTHRQGTWPFVKGSSYAFSEVEDLIEDVVTRRRKRSLTEYEYNRLRVRFQDGTEWNLLQEFHTGTRVRALGERLSEATGILLTSA